MKRKKQAEEAAERALIPADPKAKRYARGAQGQEDATGFADSMSDAFKQSNEKKYFALLIVAAVIIVILLVGALSDILTLCFNINRWCGYAMVALTAVLIALFVVRPIVKVAGARFLSPTSLRKNAIWRGGENTAR